MPISGCMLILMSMIQPLLSDYSWTLVKGADGTQGTPGKTGTDGKTPYFHTAWSYSADGTDRFHDCLSEFESRR